MLNKLKAAVTLCTGLLLSGCITVSGPSEKPSSDLATRYDPQALFAPLTLPHAANAYRAADGRPGPMYWQNRADYQLHATLDTEHNRLNGDETITYTNNSPQTLDKLWVQLDQNLYRKDSRGTINSLWRRGQFTQGFEFKQVTIEYDGQRYAAAFDVTDTRMRIDLKEALPAKGGQLKIHINYHYQIPGTWGGRTAVTPTKHGKIFEMAQWYPRMAVYDDLNGWNTDPYLGSEFYLEYGDFDYQVTVPADYFVVGSGALVNPQQVLSPTQQRRLNKAKNSEQTVYIRRPDEVVSEGQHPQTGTLTWHFNMQHTRDVAFAASPAFVVDAARINLPEDKHALAMSAYPTESVGSDRWDRSTEYVKGVMEDFSKRWTPYPWPVAVNLGGHGAGMEYPGIVFDGMNDKDDFLFWISAHELGHSWFPMIVGSNERRHAFMDEGFNTFIDVYASDDFNDGEFAPKRDSEYAPHGGNPVEEIQSLLADAKAPNLMAHADSVKEQYRHSVSYFKGALGLVLLREQILGPKRFDKAFREYIKTWSYKHPSPSDFFRFMSSAAGENLDWWWRGWYLHNWQIDMGISDIKPFSDKRSTGTALTLTSRQPLVMPVTVRFYYTDGSQSDQRIPVEVWRQRQQPRLVLPFTKPVRKAVLDPEHQIPDADRSNNTWLAP